ncbi:uncharacterized protein LOC125650241 [Ostrea edulis]|uniref:uncharacterized protein LOC125650241 n=1 Tax=Ostrea edulis TaxID=37623 RepID=UPI0024AE8AD8|nr:uncharacterized protein LOC125650241 [Ostrea edulis]XP_056021347.1 uncharacterized protein LOC125650241 [Ostrea edulis]XP_056021348.1 uncharacterized protein LOC125650241 [Ostrea edulis]XP_056021349.1 uncharacterized protein LOC125650241 [Ostrea edulis]XP_056021350.1 uncharacterized protein LOC125650241 [Ostrea edulis]
MYCKTVEVGSVLILLLVLTDRVISYNCSYNPCNTSPYRKDTDGLTSLVDKKTINVPIATFSCSPADKKHRVKLTCRSEDYQVKGTTESTCNDKQSKWEPALPSACVPKPKVAAKDNKWVYIGGGLGGGVLAIIVVVVIVSIICYKSKLRSEKARKEMKMKRFGSHTLGPNGERLFSNGNLHDIDTSLHKVWTCKRTRKKFFNADTLSELVTKAGSEYGCQGNVRLVLEEDGTQVDTDETLQACAGKVMLVLGGNQIWQPEIELYDNESYRLTFDVCSYDRKDRKLILADCIKDLKYQGSSSFGYSVTSVCLEEDGTFIDNDRTLCSCSMRTLMLLGAEHVWKGSPGSMAMSMYRDISPHPESNSEQPEMGMFKVWSGDRRIKKVVFAENVIDLHIKASKALGLQTPVVITLENNETFEITDDNVLKENSGKILIVREMVTETSFNDPVYHEPTGQHQQLSWAGHQTDSVNYNDRAFNNDMYRVQNPSVKQSYTKSFISSASYRA